jgi:hypothetical protein
VIQILQKIHMQTSLTARIVDAFGTVEKKLPGSSSFRPLSIGDRLPAASVLRTGKDAALLVELPDHHVLRVGAGSTVILNQLGQDKQFALKVISGQVWALVKKANHPSKFTVETVSGVAGVTGTLFAVGLDEETQEMVVSTEEGSVEVQSYDASGAPLAKAVPVRAGMMLRAARQRTKLIAFKQEREHQTMWHLLQREGSWAQQKSAASLKLAPGRETELFHYLHQHARRLQQLLPIKRSGRQKPGIRRS